MPFTHRVRRPWGGQNPTTAGQLVDASGYRNLMQLEKLLYIVPLNESEAATANTPTEAQAMPPTDDPIKEHVVPVPDEPRVAPGPPQPPPADTPQVEAQRPAMVPPDSARKAPAGQEPAIVPNDETAPNRDDVEEARRKAPEGFEERTQPGDVNRHYAPTPQPGRATPRRRLPE